MQKLLLWITPTFSRSSLLLIGTVFISLCLTDQALGQLFRPTVGQTWVTTVGTFAIVFGIPVLYSLFASVYRGGIPAGGQNFLIVVASLIYFFIGNIAGWNNFVNNSVHLNTFIEKLKDFALLAYAIQSYALLLVFILVIVIRYQNKSLNLLQVFDNSPIKFWLVLQIILVCTLPYIGLHYLRLSWIENLAFCTFIAINISKLHLKMPTAITV